MDYKSDVFFIDAHAKCVCCQHERNFALHKCVLHVAAFAAFELAVVAEMFDTELV